MTDVDTLLAEAAAATAACDVPAPKKERVKKSLDGGAAVKPEKAAKETKAPKEPKAPKQYPQANEDGTPALNEDGSPVLGPKETAYKAPKAKREGRSDKYPATAVIDLLAATNPKREGSASHARFAAYASGQTVAEALAAGLTTGDFHHDVAHGFISIQVGEVAEAPAAE